VRVLQEGRGFTQQAIQALSPWKFQPAELDGKLITASIPMAFSVSEPAVWGNWHAN